MEQSTIKIGIDRLCKNFGKSYGVEAIRLIAEELRNEPEPCMKQTVDRLILESSTLPPPAKVIALVRDFASQQREREGEREKSLYKPITEVEPATNYGKRAIALIKQLFDGGISMNKYLLAVTDMAEEKNDLQLAEEISLIWKRHN